MTKTGVYQICNLINNKFYIGSIARADGFDRRWYEHDCALRNNRHINSHLQNAWNKYSVMLLSLLYLKDVFQNYALDANSTI